MSKKCSRRAFTLVELLVVLAIVAVLIGVTLPVLGRARVAAKKSVSISNLRQCGQALIVYADDWGDFPVGDAADAALAKAPTWDPNDNWRNAPSDPWTKPRIGSYGYVRHVSAYRDPSDWARLANEDSSRAALLVSIYYGSRFVEPFVGEEPLDPKTCFREETCIMPDKLLKVYADSHASTRRSSTFTVDASSKRGTIFTWGAVFWWPKDAQ